MSKITLKRAKSLDLATKPSTNTINTDLIIERIGIIDKLLELKDKKYYSSRNIVDSALSNSYQNSTESPDDDNISKSIILQCDSLARLFAIESHYPDINISKKLFTTKSKTNILTLCKCLSLNEIDIKLSVIQVLSKISNLSFLAKNGLTMLACSNLKLLYSKNCHGQGLLDNLLLLIRLARYDSKLPLFARLSGIVEQTARLLYQNDIVLIEPALKLLKIMVKNENNLVIVKRANIVPKLLELLVEDEIDAGIDILAALAKSDESKVKEILQIGMKTLLEKCLKSSKCMKAWLQLLKSLNGSVFGRKEFNSNDGVRIMLEILEKDKSNSQSIIIETVRSAIEKMDLPYIERLIPRKFSIPEPIDGLQTFEECEKVLDEYINSKPVLHDDSVSNPITESIIKKMKELCPEIHAVGEDNALCNYGVELHSTEPMARTIPSTGHTLPEPLLAKSKNSSLNDISKILLNNTPGKLVYDINDPSIHPPDLQFTSKFESGNLHLAIQHSPTQYDLILQDDINTTLGRHTQWFYFGITGMKPVEYQFNIINMSKGRSQFSHGMQVCLWSKQKGWHRRGGAGYTRNRYRKGKTNFSTVSFAITFDEMEKECYVAYHYPYSYEKLQKSLMVWSLVSNFKDCCRKSLLCKTVGGIDCDLLTITDYTKASPVPMVIRKYVFLSARVHPGESPSSYIMHGLIQFLLSNNAVASKLRQNLIFKIVPMLNPDDVVHGNHRCGLAGKDLNRQWKNPDIQSSPTIFWTKLLYTCIIKSGAKILLACDFHAHSRKKNVFMYGCDGKEAKQFPQYLARISSIFDINSCKCSIEKSKENTARIQIYKNLGIINSYTLESTFCGMNFGDKRGLQIQCADLEQLGIDFCRAINLFLLHSTGQADTLEHNLQKSLSSPKVTKRKKMSVRKTKPTLDKSESNLVSKGKYQSEDRESDEQSSSSSEED